MMKKIKKIGGLVAMLVLNMYNFCFADVVSIWIDPETGEWHGIDTIKPSVPETKPVTNILIGILVLIVVACAVIIIRRIIKKKKEKENDNN